MKHQENKNKKNTQPQVDAILERLVKIVFSYVQAEKLATKKPININHKYEHATK